MKLFKDKNLQAMFGVTLMGVLGVASITPAFPRIIHDLGIEPGQVGLLITVFTLPGIFLSPFLGVLADRWGRKRILVPSLVLFAVAGSACGFVRDFQMLLIFRFLQGTGGAALASLSGTVIGDLYSGKQRSEAMGYNASILSVGTASYPAIGGALAMFGWHYPFFLPLLALPVAYLVMFVLHNPEPQSHGDLAHYLKGAWGIIRNRTVLGLFMVSIATFVILYGSLLTFFPILLSSRFGASTLQIGLIMSAMSVTTGLTSTQTGKLAARYSEKNLVKAAFLLYGAALAIVPVVPELGLFLVPIIIYGMGQGLNIPSLMSLMAGCAPTEHRGILMAVNGTVLRFGQTLGPLVMGVSFAVWGINGPFYTGVAMALIVFVVGVIAVR